MRVKGRGKGGELYAVVDGILAAGVVVDIDCHAAEGRDFGGEFGEARVVLPEGIRLVRVIGLGEWRGGFGLLFSFVGVGHGGD